MNSNPKINSLKFIISLVALSLFVVPLSYGFYVKDPIDDLGAGVPTWNPEYFYSDEIFLILVSPFYLLWAVYLNIHHITAKKVLIFALLAMTAFYDFVCFLSISFPMQDYSPDIGMLLLFSLFPLLIILVVVEYYAGKGRVFVGDESVLDEGDF